MVKSDLKAASLLVLPFFLGAFMFATLDLQGPLYWAGQICGAIFLAQCFVLIHEFGHNSLFKTKALNTLFGHIVSLFVFIPFFNWKGIHDLHHKWTGWRDKDPTTEKTFSGRLTPFQRNLINFCWKFYVPLFTLGYRFGIYWKVEKLKRHLRPAEFNVCILNMLAMIMIYFALISLHPMSFVYLLPALYLSMVITDIISMSQHSSIEMPVSHGEKVTPLKYQDQAQYSRSLILPSMVSEYVLFNVNYHEAHHCYPGLPCYYLPRINPGSSNSYNFLPWLMRVKKIPGVDFVFTTNNHRDQY